MRPKTSPTGRSASSRGPWIAAAAFLFVVGAACTDQGEATDRGANPPPAADPGANANLPPEEQARTASKAPAEPSARAGVQDREGRQRRIAEVREDRYATLDLSDEQKQRIDALRAEQDAWRAEHRDEVRTLANQRKAARQAGDEAEAEAIRQQLLELRETLPTEKDIAAVLTDEQRKQLRKNRPFNVMGRPPGRQAPADQAADAAPAPE